MHYEPCPFCGASEESISKCDIDDQYYMECCSCAATGPWCETKEEAEEAWNTRR